jgi:Tfp pilus assembly protein PilN
MIEINLLPEELKVKTKRLGKVSIESKYFLYLIPLVSAVLILVHICLAAVGIVKGLQFSQLNNKWKKLQPQRELLNNLKKEYDVVASNAELIQELNSRRLNWSEKLNRLSRDLPSGIWFNEILVSRKDFVLKASVVSLQKEEMSLINKFMDSLKNDTRFLIDFNKLELGLVQKKSVGGYDVVDFILTAKLKAK